MKGRLLAVAAAAIAVFYGRAWRFDLQCDDFVFIRPWSAAELARVWHGTWDPQRADPVFFRPLTSWFFAGTFELFGVNATAHLLLSLALLIAVVFVLAWFVARESQSVSLGALAAVIYAAHPNTPWSTGVWVLDDFHKLAALAVFGALLTWQRVRYASATAWLPLFALATAAFLIKEDNIVLMPALLALQWARARMVRDVAAPSAALWLLGAGFCAALWTWRWSALGQLGGLPLPSSLAMIVRNLLRGPYYVMIGQGNESLGFAAMDFAIGACVIAGIAFVVSRLQNERRWLAIAALILMAAYNAPLVLISNVTRYYIVTLAGAMILALVGAHIWSTARIPITRAAFCVGACALLIAAGVRQQAVLQQFAVCGRLPIDCRAFALESFTKLPPEARALMVDLPDTCRAGTAHRGDASETLTWGLGRPIVDTMTGLLARDAESHVVSLLRPTAASATFVVRHPDASAQQPVDVVIAVNGHDMPPVHLINADWVAVDAPLERSWRTWLRGMHRADVRFSVNGEATTGAEWQPVRLRH